MTARAWTMLAILPLALLAGCRQDITEVVLVVQSDLMVPAEANQMDVAWIEGPFAPEVTQFFGNGTTLAPFPSSVGFTSAESTTSFSITVRLFTGAAVPPDVLVSRTVTDIRFVAEETVMLVLPMNRACACQGTSCPEPGNPECDNIHQPALVPFDPAVAPPSSMIGAGTGNSGSGGTTRPPAPDKMPAQ